MRSTYAFIAGASGEWRIRSIAGYLGESLDPAQRLAMRPFEPGMDEPEASQHPYWADLRDRYSAGLGRLVESLPEPVFELVMQDVGVASLPAGPQG